MEIKPGYTRVTEVLSQWKLLSSIPPSILERKAKIGTEVHELLAAQSQNVFMLPSAEAKPYVESWEEWRKTVQGDIVGIEERLYCDQLKITGCLDARVCLPGNYLSVIVDYKTSSGVSPTWPLQTTFYHYLAETNGLSVQERTLIVVLNPDGFSPKVYEYKATKSLWKICEGALACYRFLKG